MYVCVCVRARPRSHYLRSIGTETLVVVRVKGWGDEEGLHFFEDSPGFHSSGFRV
jgi:hypothetical protein